MYVKFVGIHAPLKLTAAFMKWNEISLFLAMLSFNFHNNIPDQYTLHILFYFIFYKKVDSNHNNDNYNRNFFI